MRTLLMLLLITELVASRAHAQNPHRQGFWMEFGTGAASVRVGCGGCEDVTTSTGSGAFIRFGGTVSPKMLVGLELYGFTDEGFGFDESDTSVVANSASISGVAIWYPWRHHFFLKGGVGIAEGSFSVISAPTDTVIAEGLGVGLTFGLGMDIPISRRFSISGNLGTYITGIGDIRLPGLVVDDVIPTTYLASVGFTLR